MKNKPYTYYLYHRPTGKKYYGVRFGRNCKPEDLWITYFTSSKRVKNLIEEYGKDSFDVEVRKTFNSKESAYQWETKVLQKLNVVEKEEWLNTHDNDGRYYNKGGYKLKENHIKQISERMKGKKLSEDHRKNLSLNSGRRGKPGTRLGHHHTQEAKEKLRQANLGKKAAKQKLEKMKIIMTERWKKIKEEGRTHL